ncbi:DUF397 domain-containing protein [Embleya sp. NPDC005575]|uniref:DUF397 domain-containing protein n=1 Tax=Embleya sp. NPDC005575 TaxID=3156892 RepID=UPI0033ADC9C0
MKRGTQDFHTLALTGVTWRKSSYSAAEHDCVEVAGLAGSRVALRDSKRPTGGAFRVPGCAWGAFLARAS